MQRFQDGTDVKAVRETLEEQGFVVKTLMNPTKNRLLNGIIAELVRTLQQAAAKVLASQM